MGSASEHEAAPAAKTDLKTALLIGNPLFDLSAVEQAAAERKLATDEANGALVASTAAPLRADDDDIQVPNVLNAPPASAVIAYDQPVIAIAHRPSRIRL